MHAYLLRNNKVLVGRRQMPVFEPKPVLERYFAKAWLVEGFDPKSSLLALANGPKPASAAVVHNVVLPLDGYVLSIDADDKAWKLP